MKLISTDFDGTLIDPESDGRCHPAFAAALDDHAREGGLWAINTGRSLKHILEGLDLFRPPVAPDFLLTNERDVYVRDGAGWVAHGSWNETCSRRHTRLFQEAEKIFSFVKELNAEIPHFTILYEKDLPAGLITTTEEVMERVAAEITQAAADHPDFAFQRNTIYLRFCHRAYHKGSALGELCRLEGLSNTDVFAVGDNLNDLSMLDGRHAALTACPANALPLVKETVLASGGYVARGSFGAGVAEAMQHFRAKEKAGERRSDSRLCQS
jgi:HAD superfamily hydrolase (TIGR01484 family)